MNRSGRATGTVKGLGDVFGTMHLPDSEFSVFRARQHEARIKRNENPLQNSNGMCRSCTSGPSALTWILDCLTAATMNTEDHSTQPRGEKVIDLDELRTEQIRLHSVDKADVKYTFYHDETNNIRKLHIGDRGFNVTELKVFVLGGVVHEGDPHPIDIQSLRQAMRIQQTATEIKLEHVAKGTFLDILRSAKLTMFLQWITDNGLMIHYHDLDPLYWSFIDIIDSILANWDNPILYQYHALLKSDLTAVLRADLTNTVGILHRHGYPSLAAESRTPFLNELIELLERNSEALPEFNFQMLKGVLQFGQKLDELVFIEGNTPDRLIDDFRIFYLDRLAIFKHSSHILDMEESIRDRLEDTPITWGGIPATHYRFADSKAEPGIQLSDVVVGVLGKMHTYFTETDQNEVMEMRAQLIGTSLKNAELLRDLISASDASNRGFLHSVGSIHDRTKLDMFLRFHDGAYAE